jgi:dTDP-4-amino-4,6-dideoxygalactose transaminase
MESKILFNQSALQGCELEYISASITSGQIAGDQIFSKRCQKLLEDELGIHRALVTTSCTHALEMVAILLNITYGDEVILPAFTFVSTANAFVLRGAVPVFCDIREDTLNLDEAKLERLITPKTRAIVVVHYAGVACEMDPILEIATRHGVPVVEDNAHGLFGKYHGQWLGTFGTFSTQSFHETKNITCGEGGAILINDKRFVDRAEIIREKGTNRTRFFRGQIDKYSWVDVGSSYVMSDILAAFLCAQLEKWKEIQAKRKQIWETYHYHLEDWSVDIGARRPSVPIYCEQAWHMYYLLMPSLEIRQNFILSLKNKGIMAVFHYLPLNKSDFITKRIPIKYYSESFRDSCSVTQNISERIVRIPFYTALSQKDQMEVITAIKSFL